MPSRKSGLMRGDRGGDWGWSGNYTPKPVDENLLFNEGPNRTVLMTPVSPCLYLAYKVY